MNKSQCSDSEARLLDYLRRHNERRGLRFKDAVDRIAVPLTLADIMPDDEDSAMLNDTDSSAFGFSLYKLIKNNRKKSISDWTIEGKTLANAGIIPAFRVGLLAEPSSSDELQQNTPIDIPEDWTAVQVAGRWMFDGFHHPGSETARASWIKAIASGRRIAAWGFSMIPHFAGIGAAPMVFFGKTPPATYMDFIRSSVTTGPLLYYTAGGKEPGETVSSKDKYRRKWLEICFKAADAVGLDHIAIHADGTEMRRLDARGRRDYDATLQVEIPDSACAVWITCRSVDGRLCVVNPVWVTQ